MHRHLLYVAADREADPIRRCVEDAGWTADSVAEIETARDRLGEQPFDVGLIDLEPFRGGLAEVESLCCADACMRWVALVPRSRRDEYSVLQLIRDNFFDYHTLPVDTDRLLHVLGHADGMAKLDRALSEQKASIAVGAQSAEPEMVGVGAPMKAVFDSIRKIASVDAPVLIHGESGTGKELAARAIFERSRRADGPFIVVNSAALPASLIQAELFGHERGAFTGAVRRRKGSLELADGGVIFLDEIGDLPLEQQVNLLRFLQEGTLTRIGGSEEIQVDARVIAATNVDLERAVAEGRFREDLYFRLNVLNLRMPPLRQRREDIPVLARFFFERFAHEKSRRLRGFSRKAMEALSSHDWPGNIRELINRVRRAMVMCDARLIGPEDLGLSDVASSAGVRTLQKIREEAENTALRRALAASNRNLTDTARRLGISRPALYRLLDRHDLKSSSESVAPAGRGR